jgi:hypothetical protein
LTPLFLELALLAARPDVPPEALVRSRDFHHSRAARQIDAMRKTAQRVAATPSWPSNALARLEGMRVVSCFVASSSFVIGRGSKCDLDLSSAEWPSVTLSRTHAVLSLKSDGRMWLAVCGKNGLVLDGVLMGKGAVVPLPVFFGFVFCSLRLICCFSRQDCCVLQIGGSTLVMQQNMRLLQQLVQN